MATFSFSALVEGTQLRGIPRSERTTSTRRALQETRLPGTSARRCPINSLAQRKGWAFGNFGAGCKVLRGKASSRLYADSTDDSIQYLLSVGFSGDDLCKLITSTPDILSLPKSRLQDLLEFLLGLVVSTKNIRSIVLRHPDALLAPLDTKTKPVVDFLYDLGLDRESVCSILVRYPHVLRYGVKSELTPQVHYLVSLGVSREALPELVKERPQVLGAYIDPVIRYLKMLGLKRKDIGKMLASFPIDYSIPVQCPEKTTESQQD